MTNRNARRWKSWVRSLSAAPARFRRPILWVEVLEDRSLPATITGLAFEDFNANGVFDTTVTQANAQGGVVRAAIDRGVVGVNVAAYDVAGTQVAATTTSATGTYTLSAAGITVGQPYRVVFSALPAGFVPGPHGAGNGTTVQFVNGGAANVNVGLVRPEDYSPNNPSVVGERYIYGDQLTGAGKDTGVVLSFPYTAGGTTNDSATPAATVLAKASQVGTVFGLAVSRPTGIVYAAAYTKLHAGYGPSGNGAIYAINPATNTVTTFADLNALFGANTAGVNFRAGYAAGDAPYDWDSINAPTSSWDTVGKTALGGMAVSDDGSTLYVMNLADRRLYAVPLTLGRPVTAADVQSVSIPFTAPGATGTAGGTQAGDLRPFAVTYHDGLVYVGIVNSAQSTQSAADLHAYVYTVDPATLAFGAAPVFTIANMTYARDFAARFAGVGPSNWHPWSATFQDVSTTGLVYAQPMLTGIVFDAAGNLTLGFRDRVGDQGGDKTFANPGSPGTTYETYPAGETLRAFGSPAAGWVLESNGKGPGGAPTGQQPGSGFGPGGGQFYRQDYGSPGGHGYVEVGGLLQLPGFPDAVVSAYDPFLTGAFRTGGVRWQDTGNGAIDKGYQLYFQDQPGTFGKANGVGALAAILPEAPLEIGNRVFRDQNANGVQDAGEPGISGVTVRLYTAAGAALATVVTDAAGNYYFSSAAGTNVLGTTFGVPLAPTTAYSVRVDLPANYTGVLAGLTPTVPLAGADRTIDSDGVPVAAADTRAAVTTTGFGAADHTADFGFAPGLSLGNLVWDDANNNGRFDAGEGGLDGVTVSLRDGAGNPVLGPGGSVVTTTTAGGGVYLFTGLLPGTYQVQLSNLPAGYVSSTGAADRTGPVEPGSTDYTAAGNNTDHGTSDAGGTVTSQPVTLAAPGSNPDAGAGGPGTANLNVDLGLFRPLSLGDLVWDDADDDGRLDNGEAGIDGVLVQLLDGAGNPVLGGAGNPVTATTAGGGAYLFKNLGTGTYQVRLAAANFAAGGPLAGYVSSTGTNGRATGPVEPGSPDYSAAGNNTDHGSATSGTITSQPVTLSAGTNPDLGGAANLNVDFGVFRPLSLGNFVWTDTNNNGVADPGEPGIGGVAVSLLGAGGAVVAQTTTTAAGYYLFTNLVEGTYTVRIDAANFAPGGPLAGFLSSTGGPGGGYEPATQGLGGDDTDHGTAQPDGSVTGLPVTLTRGGEATGQPATPGIPDPAADGNRDVSQDFGFFTGLSLGNRVFIDRNNDGAFNGTDAGLDGVTVELLDAGGAVVQTTATATAGGLAGSYRFDNLLPGTYTVRLSNLPPGFVSSTGTNGSPAGPVEPGSTDYTDAGNDTDHGSATGATITSRPVTLTAGTNPDAGGTANFNVDFGVFPALSVGNRVWNDANNSGTVDPGELAIPGVAVSLLDAANGNAVVATTATNAGGYYLFSYLVPGQYRVQIDAANFAPGGALTGFASSTGAPGSATGPFEPSTATANDQDHGTAQPGGAVFGPVLSLGVGTAPTGEEEPAGATGLADPAADANADATQDFGFFGAAALGDTVFLDATANGLQDDGPGSGVDGVTVTLFSAGPDGVFGTADDPAAPVASQVTANGGKYLFAGLPPGVYAVAFSNLPAGLLFTRPSAGAAAATDSDADPATGRTGPITLAAGQTDVTWDAGLVAVASVAGHVYFDANANGGRDGGDVPLGGATVTLTGTDDLGTTITPVVIQTQADGSYLFPNLRPGTYTVTETQPAGYAQGTDTLGGPGGGSAATQDVFSGIVLLSGTNGVNYDFGELGTAIGDTVFEDSNNNGRRDPGEPGLPGVTVQLLNSGGAVLTSQQTGAAGDYLFTNLAPGTYRVRVGLPAGYFSSTGGPGATGPAEPGSGDVSDAGNDLDHGTTDAGGLTVTSGPVPTAAGPDPDPGPTGPNTAVLNVDFGVFRPLSLGDTVWLDANNDGTRQPGEAGVGNVAVSLLDGAGTVLATTTTNAQGGYLFAYLAPGTYQVRIDAANFAPGGALAGTVSSSGLNGSAAGPFEPATGATGDGTDHGTAQAGAVLGGLVNLQRGTAPTGEAATPGGIADPAADADADHTQDFGFYLPLSLGDLVFRDDNNNGTRDPGEPGLGGLSVTLLDGTGNPLPGPGGQPITTTTDPNGLYRFGNLLPGSYRVRVAVPAGFTSSTGTNGAPAGPYEPGVSGSQDSADHGTLTAPGVAETAVVTLAAPGGNPDTVATPGDANLRQDFGLFPLLSLGDRVFLDANNNGTFDPGESGVGGVAVTLLDGAGASVATATTSAAGYYLFTDLTPGTYRVRIDAANFAPGGPLAGTTSSTGTYGSATGPAEPSPLGLGNDGADHGTTQPGGAVLGNAVTLTVGGQATGQPATPGLADAAADGNRDVSQDFGFFTPLSVGDLVFDDLNNNGVCDPGEPGVGAVPVRLYDAAGTLVASTATDPNGVYGFTNLIPGQYRVEVTLPAGYASSSGANGSRTGPYEPGLPGADLTNAADHGTGSGVGGTATTQLFTLLAPGQNPDAGGTANLRQDFGVFQPLSVGDLVFADANNNGVADPGETGIGGVKVELLDAGGAVVATTTTNAQGGYLFSHLSAGIYRVRVTTPDGSASSTGQVGALIGPYEPAPNNNADGQDKGTVAGGVVLGGPIDLRPGTQPTGEAAAPGGITDPAPDANGNRTQDFGFVATRADVSITIVPDSPRVVLGGPDPFTVTVTNNGPIPTTGVVAGIVLPPGVVPVGGTGPGTYDPATGLWSIGALPVGASVVLRLTTLVNTPGPVTATAVVSSDQTDVVPANNRSAAPVSAVMDAAQITKRDFLASTPAAGAGAAVAPESLPPPLPGSRAVVATGAGPGAAPLVEEWDRASGQLRLALLAYDAGFTGGVNVALADVNRDGVPDLVTAPMSGGGPNVRVFDGRTGAQLASFFAFEPTFTGGVNLAAGDVDKDGVPEIIAGAGMGGAPRVVVFRADGTPVSSLFAYDSAFRSGVTVAAGDLDGDGRAEVIAGAGAGGGPNVKAFDALTGAERLSFFAFDPSFRGGVNVAAGYLDGTNRASILASPGVGGGPVAAVFDGQTGQQTAAFLALAPDFRGGVRVASADLDGDGMDDLLASPQAGGGPVVSGLDPRTGGRLDGFLAFAPGFAGGAALAAVDKAP